MYKQVCTVVGSIFYDSISGLVLHCVRVYILIKVVLILHIHQWTNLLDMKSNSILGRIIIKSQSAEKIYNNVAST